MAPAPSDVRWTPDVLPTVAPATRAASPVATLFLLLAPGLGSAGARVWGALVTAFRRVVPRRRCAARFRAQRRISALCTMRTAHELQSASRNITLHHGW